MFEVTARTWQFDGLNSIQYENIEVVQNKLYTLFEVDVNAKKIREVSGKSRHKRTTLKQTKYTIIIGFLVYLLYHHLL